MNVCGKDVHIEGQWLRRACMEDGYQFVDDPEALIEALRKSGNRIDLFTFMQPLSEMTPRYDYPMEWDNRAALSVSTFDQWFTEQINGKTRNMIRKAQRMEATTREVPFDDRLIEGIAAINNESPIRQGMRYWHYGDDLETVRKKNGTFLETSVFLGVFYKEELIGYAKLVIGEGGRQAGLMQILTLIRHRDKAPSNLLIAQAVRSCADRGIPYLFYSKFSYGQKQRDSLSDFKEHNGFRKLEVPRYHVPLTSLGRIALGLGLHRGVKEYVPGALLESGRRFRNLWYRRKFESAKGSLAG
jgi:hypothetical protein